MSRSPDELQILVDAYQVQARDGGHTWLISVDALLIRIVTFACNRSGSDYIKLSIGSEDVYHRITDEILQEALDERELTWEDTTMIHVRFQAPRQLAIRLLNSPLTIDEPCPALNELFSRIGKAISEASL